MNDGIIKGTGDSRYLKGSGWPSTYAEFKAMAEAGTLPFDLNGINAAGWQQLATALNKANLLSDSTASKKSGIVTVNDFLSNCAFIEHGTYTGTGTYGSENPNSLTFGFVPKVFFISTNYTGSSGSTGGRIVSPYVCGSDYIMNQWGGSTYYIYATTSSNTISWYSFDGAPYQLNISGATYYWAVIG